MKLIIDTQDKTLSIIETNEQLEILDLYSKEAFEIISSQWLKVGWNQKYTYTFSWFGRPIIQLPEDMIRIQEVIYAIKPDVIIETGVAHGGSIIYYASILKALGKGRVIGIDIEIRPHNRQAIEQHEFSSLITLVEGSSTDLEVFNRIKSLIKSNESVLVILDSNHSKNHVLRELELYGAFVSLGSYIVATDGIMRDLENVPRSQEGWTEDNPAEAALEFTKNHPEFVIEPPPWPFNESELSINVTHWPNAYMRRKV